MLKAIRDRAAIDACDVEVALLDGVQVDGAPHGTTGLLKTADAKTCSLMTAGSRQRMMTKPTAERFLNFRKDVVGNQSFRIIHRPHEMEDGVARAAFTLILTGGRNRSDMLASMETLVRRLEDVLLPKETLECRDRAFFISGEGYEFCLTVEGFGKHSYLAGYRDSEGNVQCDFLHRMGMYEAKKRAGALYGAWNHWYAENSPIMGYLVNQDMLAKFPNPADRFVHAFLEERKRWKKRTGLPCTLSSVLQTKIYPDISF